MEEARLEFRKGPKSQAECSECTEEVAKCGNDEKVMKNGNSNKIKTGCCQA